LSTDNQMCVRACRRISSARGTTTNMSRFFRGDDSESESSSDEELYSDDEAKSGHGSSGSDEESESEDASDSSDDGLVGPSKFLKKGAGFLVGATDEESEDEGKRQIKSARDKRVEEIQSTIRAIENGEKINDWNAIYNEFEKLNRVVERVKSTDKVPKGYIKCIAELEDFTNEMIQREKEKKKTNAPATKGRAINSVKQRVRKNNRAYESEIAAFREDPEKYVKEEEISDEPVTKAPRTKGEDEVVIDGVVQKGYVAPEEDDDEGFATVGKSGRVLQFTSESIFKHLRNILEARGKKNTDRSEQIKVLEKLNEVADSTYKKLRVLLTLISTRFDLTSGALTALTLEQWKAASNEMNTLLGILEADADYVVEEDVEDLEDDSTPSPKPGEPVRVRGSVISFIDRLDDEMTKALQGIDPHTVEYIERLTNETVLYALLLRGQMYFERAKQTEALNRTIMRRLEHLYFKPEQIIEIMETKAWDILPAELDSVIYGRNATKDSTNLLYVLCVHLYKQDASLLRTRAMLCHIYHHALHNRFHRARDMLLMSHLQETIHAADVSTMILYNRTMVQVGLCAFRLGMIQESQTTLQEICGSGRQKELLAQGMQIQRYAQQISPEQERLERQRQLPFHMHINLELLECVYLTCSMLLEIPAMAAAGSGASDARKRVISKPFRRMLDFAERQAFTGPPENTRDHIMQAAKALSRGDWQACIELIEDIKVWSLMPEADKIKVMLAQQIGEQGLRTYIFTYAPFYDTISIARLSEIFDLSVAKVRAIVSRMISHEEISAALDQVNSAIVFGAGVEMSKLQSLAVILSDKANGLVESNERLLESKTQRPDQQKGEGGEEDGKRRNIRGGGRRSDFGTVRSRVPVAS